MLTINFNNFELFGSPYRLLSINHSQLVTTPKFMNFSKNTNPFLIIPLSIRCQGVAFKS